MPMDPGVEIKEIPPLQRGCVVLSFRRHHDDLIAGDGNPEFDMGSGSTWNEKDHDVRVLNPLDVGDGNLRGIAVVQRLHEIPCSPITGAFPSEIRQEFHQSVVLRNFMSASGDVIFHEP